MFNAVRDPTPELGGSFNGAVYRDFFRNVLASANNAGTTLVAVHAPNLVEDPTDAGYLSGIVAMGAADGLRVSFVMEPGAGSPVFTLGQLSPVLRAPRTIPDRNAAYNAGAYIQQPVSDVSNVPMVEGTLTIGATLAAALVAAGVTGALSTWRFAHQITTPTTPMTGIDVWSPGNNQVAHLDFFPSQGIPFMRLQTSQTATTKVIVALVRRLRGDAQGT